MAATHVANQSNEIARQSNMIAKTVYAHNQADKISVWLTQGEQGDDIVLRNGSDAPIYDVFVGGGISNKGDTYKLIKGLATDTCSSSSGLNHSLGVVSPGTWLIKANVMMHGIHAVVGATVVFKDGNGKTWVRDASGDLHDKGYIEPASVLGLYELGEVPYGQEGYSEYLR